MLLARLDHFPRKGNVVHSTSDLPRAGERAEDAVQVVVAQDVQAPPGHHRDPQRLEPIVDYFDRMVFRDVPAEASPGELYFRYLVELAARDREVLLANRVIRKDREMDAAFSVLMLESRVAPRPWMRPRGKARG